MNHTLPSSKISPGNGDDARWFAEEVRPHEQALRDWLRARFPSLPDIDDLVQETYVRLFQARRAGSIAEARPYLFVIARNTALDLCRRKQVISFETLGNIDASPVVEGKPSSADATAYAQEIDLLREAIATLPERCREVLVLRKLEGRSYREIAHKLGISEKTVDAHICAGIFRCRKYLREKGVDHGRLEGVKGRAP